MRYWYDTEFLEDGRTIELISIGIVAEDGREYYAVNRDFRWRRIAGRCWYAPWQIETRQQWLADNVVPSLPRLHGDAINLYSGRGPLGMIDWQALEMRRRDTIAAEVRDFLLAGPSFPKLWTWYGAYDHVVLCQLWGRMIDLPHGIPMYSRDLKQEVDRVGDPTLPEQPDGVHNALADARHLRTRHLALESAA
ncbi:DnaQ-like DNA polymerase III subunit [Microcystis phage Mwe-JY05]